LDAKIAPQGVIIASEFTSIARLSVSAPSSQDLSLVAFTINIAESSFRHTQPASPWQNGFAERLIGSIRRECLDHIIVLGEAHLRRILKSYTRYYNETRTHLALDKDAPLSRTVMRAGRILCRPVLGGLHHEYVRI
jgi:hypothetical protein